jgi:hypothetical protein
MTDVVEYGRAVPPEWMAVESAAHTELERSGRERPTPAAVNTVLDVIQTLDNEALESARFYGLGLIMCGLARQLQHPDIRQRVVTHAARNVVEWRAMEDGYNADGLCMNDFDQSHMNVAFRRYVQVANYALPAWQRLAANALDIDNCRRADEIAGRPARSRHSMIDDVIGGEKAAWLVELNVTSASTSVLRNAMRKVIADQELPDTEAPKPDSFAAQERANGELIAPAFRAVIAQREALHALALRCAALREDEFIKDLNKYVGVNDEGILVFQQARKVRARDLLPPEVIHIPMHDIVMLHQRRLRCPAIFVDGLIPLIMDIVSEAFEKAQAQIEAQPR